MITYYYKIYDILEFSISGPDKRSLKYLDNEYHSFRSDDEFQENGIEIILGKFCTDDEPRMNLSNNQYHIGNKSSYFSDSYKLQKYNIKIDNPDNKKTMLYFNGPGISHRILQLKFLIPLIRYKLSQKGYTLIKSSSVSSEKGAYVFPSWSGGGKTSLILYLTKNGLNYNSDTFSLISENGDLYPFPNMVHVFYRNIIKCPFILEELPLIDIIQIKLKNIIYLLSIKNINFSYFIHPNNPLLNMMPDCKRKIKFLFILSQSDVGEIIIDKISDKNEACKKIMNIDIFETDQFNRFLLAYCYNNINSPLNDYWEMEEQIIKKALESTICYNVKLPAKSTQNEFKEILNIINEYYR